MLLLGVLALVNAYVFGWRDDTIPSLASLPGAAIGAGKTSSGLEAVASPPEHACSADPVRTFAGLEHLLMRGSALSQGRTLRLSLLELGVAPGEIDGLETAVRAHVDLGLLTGTGAPIRVAIDRFGGVHAVEIELAEGHLVQACRNDAGFQVRNIQHPLRSDVEVIGLELTRRGDLREAVTNHEEAPELANLIASTLAHDIDFATEARPGDHVQVMVEKRWLGRTFHRYGAILAIRYVGAAGRFTYFRYKPEGAPPAFFDAERRPMRRALLRSPVAFHAWDPASQGLFTPTIEFVDGRLGSIYRRPEGAPVVALGDGIIRSVGDHPEWGVFVTVEHEGGLFARYAHLMRTLGNFIPGQKIEQGAVLGLCGHTGRTANDRVRLELWREHNGIESVEDPMLLSGNTANRPARVGKPLPDTIKPAFERDVRAWSKALRRAG